MQLWDPAEEEELGGCSARGTRVGNRGSRVEVERRSCEWAARERRKALG